MHRFYSRSIGVLLTFFIVAAIARYTSLGPVSMAWAFSEPRLPLDLVLPGSPALQAPANQLIVVAFSDTTGTGPFGCPGCDKIYSDADQPASAGSSLPPVDFVIRNANTGEELGRQTAALQPQGQYQAVFLLPANLQDNITLSLVANPGGFVLCPNASPSRIISPSDFVLGTHEEVYPFWTGCPLESQELTQNAPQQENVPAQATPEPPTATPEPTPTTSGLPERSIVVEAFTDVSGPGGLLCPGCDRIFSSSDQVANAADPLPNMEFTLREASTGRILGRETTTLDAQGRARLLFRVPAGFDQPLTVELASDPSGFQLCPNVDRARVIQPTDFILGTHLEQFPFWKGCELPEPTPESAPTEAAPVAPTTPPSAPGGAITAVVTARGLNVRAGPSVDYARIGAVSGGTQLVLDGRNADATWVRGTAAEVGLEGWVSADFLDISSDVNALPVLDTTSPSLEEPTATPVVPATDTLTAVVTALGLNVRAGPGVNYFRLGTVAGGTQVALTGRNADGTWVRGSVPEAGLEGWFSAEFLRTDGDVNSLPELELAPSGEAQLAPTATPTIPGSVVPEKLPLTGGLDVPLWGLLAMVAALMLALGHVWRWMREVMSH